MKTNEEMISSTERYIAKLEAARKQYESAYPVDGYLVTVEGVPITLDIQDGAYVNPRGEKPHKAIRFSAPEAFKIAKKISAYDADGNEVSKGGVMHVWEAISYWIADQRKLLAALHAEQGKSLK
jgi:hypothetical protein